MTARACVLRKRGRRGGGTLQDTYYVYDTAGNLAAEYGTGTAPASGTAYPFTDLLGSVRAVTDAAGAVQECYDYLPFGRMLSASDNGRGTLSCHPASPDSSLDSRVSQKFTGQVRDEETRLDYFGARYYSAPHGRFMSPDPLMASATTRAPQSWNRYTYGANNPLRYNDPSGLYVCEGDEEECEEFRIALESLLEDAEGDTLRAAESYGDFGDENGVVVRIATIEGDESGHAGLDRSSPFRRRYSCRKPDCQRHRNDRPNEKRKRWKRLDTRVAMPPTTRNSLVVLPSQAVLHTAILL